MAQSMIERHLEAFEKNNAQIKDGVMHDDVRAASPEESVLHSSAVPEEDERWPDSPACDGEDIIDSVSVSSPMTSSSVTSSTTRRLSHRRKSTPKKRQWAPAVYSDGESAHEESYSDDQNDDNADSCHSDDFQYRRQGATEEDDDSRLVIDEERDSPMSSKDTYKTADERRETPYFNKESMVKDAIMAMRIKSEQFDDYYHLPAGSDTAGAGDQQTDNASKPANRKPEHKCPFCHFVYTSVNYLLSHLYRVHYTVDPAQLQEAIAGITAPYKSGLTKSTLYSRAPHMDERGRVIAPPYNAQQPLNLSTSPFDTTDGELPPAKLPRLDSNPNSRSSSPMNDMLNDKKKRNCLSCFKCHMRFSSRHQHDLHIKSGICSLDVYSMQYPKTEYMDMSAMRSDYSDLPAVRSEYMDMSVVRSEPEYACHHCGRKLETRYELDIHMKEHRAPSPVKCTTCDLWFSDANSLEQHMSMHDSKLKCQFCGLFYDSMEALKRHTETHFTGSAMVSQQYHEQQQSSPSSTDSDKENSPDQENSGAEGRSQPSRKLLLAELQGNQNDIPQNLTIPSRERSSSPGRRSPNINRSGFQHRCSLCHATCPSVSALVDHITKCHSNLSELSKMPMKDLPKDLSKLPFGMPNPLMALGGMYPGMYMQNPLLMGNFDPSSFPMQPNILMAQLQKDSRKAATSMIANMATNVSAKDEAVMTNNLKNLLTQKDRESTTSPIDHLKMPAFPNAYVPPYLGGGTSLPSNLANLSPVMPKKTEVDEEKKLKIQAQTEKEKPFSCGQCNKRFKRNCHLQLHKRTHADDLRSYRCPQCGMRFIQLRSLEQHLKTHSIEKPYGCDYCGKKFAQKYNLKLHIRTHTGEKPYKCSYCEMRFADPGSLNRHTRTHTGEKPYSCDYCGKKFAQKYNLHLHIRVHTHDRPFRCVYCDKRFAQKSNLLMHLKLHVEYLHQLQNGTLPNMAELLDNGEKRDGPVLPSDAELRIIETEKKKIEEELQALEKAELADKILSEEGARREKAMIFNKDELAAMGKSGLALMGMIDPTHAESLPADLNIKSEDNNQVEA